jgi:hypothetical protein
MDAQNDALKTGHLDKALQVLGRHFEATEVDDDQSSRAAMPSLFDRSPKSAELSRRAWPVICRSDLERSKARIATSRNNA